MLPSGHETAVALTASPQLWYLPSSERVKTAAQTGTHTLTKSYRYFLIAAGGGGGPFFFTLLPLRGFPCSEGWPIYMHIKGALTGQSA